MARISLDPPQTFSYRIGGWFLRGGSVRCSIRSRLGARLSVHGGIPASGERRAQKGDHVSVTNSGSGP
jgi:hypothetical protein